MNSKVYRSLLVTMLTIVHVGTGAACKPKEVRIMEGGAEALIPWFCPPEYVLFEYKEVYRCFEKRADCPNGVYHEGECHCFPGTSRDSTGVCGKICKNCENGWCSSLSKCECNEGFTLNQGQCVNPTCQTDHIWDLKTRACIPYESARAPQMNVRSTDL